MTIPALITGEGTLPEKLSRCRACQGEKYWPKPDYVEIVKGCLSSRGRTIGQWKMNTWKETAYSSWAEWVFDKRIRYVWRLGSFHGGHNIELPDLAMTILEGDPWLVELDALAEIAAHSHLGTSTAGRSHWEKLLFGDELKEPANTVIERIK